MLERAEAAHALPGRTAAVAMSLFVGNISKTVKQSEVEDEFKKFGQCVYRNKGNFSFVEYEDENAADDAKEALD